jgi:hypothetical protein
MSLGILMVLGLLLGVLPLQAEERDSVAEWHKKMIQLPKPKPGCFKAVHPKVEWKEVKCVKAPDRPFLPSRRTLPEEVGNGHDWSAQVSGQLTSVTGAFTNISGVTSIHDSKTNVANSFTLQLNTAPFSSPTCSGSGCRGWQQFIYSSNGSSGGSVFIQYWLLDYSGTCPSGWYTYSNDCYRNSNTAHGVPAQTISSLGVMSLTGTATAGGADDTILQVGNTLYSVKPGDNVLDLAGRWQIAEFNIFGNGGGSQAVFNAGSSMTVNVTVHSGTTHAPTCIYHGYTGETNNLTLVGTPSAGTQGAPAIVFNQSNGPSLPRSCSTASGSGT